MKAKEITKKIRHFETEFGESYTDRFMHDNVTDTSWAFWLLGKGYTEHANAIIKLRVEGETCIDQEILYNIHPEYDDNEEWQKDSYDENAAIWAEFLVATPYYTDKVLRFFDDPD